MSLKRKVAIVIFLLITCIATICFATKVETEKTEDLLDGEFVFEGTAKEESIKDESKDSNKDKEGYTESAEFEMPSIMLGEEVKEEAVKTLKENIYHADTNAPYTLSDNVSGNVFLAGSEITISSSYIAGDLFVAASNSVTIKEDTVIDGNVYIAAQTVNIEGTIYRTAYIAGKIINMKSASSVEYDAYLAGEKIVLEGSFDRNAYIFAETLEVKDSASVEKNLEYEAESEAAIPEGAVRGEVKFNRITVEKARSEVILDYVIKMLESLIFTLVVFIFVSLISKKFTYKSQELLGKHPFRTVGIGLFSLIIIPILAVLLLIFGATAKLGLSLIPIFITILLIANSITAIAFASLLCARRDGMKIPIVVPIMAVIIWAAEAIPVIGVLIEFVSILLGIGILMQSIFSSNKPISQGEKKEIKEETKKEEKVIEKVKEESKEEKEEVKEENKEEKKEDSEKE